MISVTTPAADKTLLTTAELRSAVGVTDNSKDAELAVIGGQVALMVARECRIASDGINDPSIKAEGVTETLRLGSGVYYVVLARRFVSAISSVTVDGTALVSGDWEVDAASGILYRLVDDERTCWDQAKTVIVYTAGFSTVPADIKRAASKLVADIYQSDKRDPNLKRLKIDGVSEREFWVPPTTDPAIPQDVADMLGPYRSIGVS